MGGFNLSRAIVLLGLCSTALAAVDCGSDVTITSIDDVRDIRDNCRVIEGGLMIDEDFAADIDLGNLEVIKGGLSYSCVMSSNCGSEEAFNVTASELTEIGDALYLSKIHGIRSISMPKLQQIQSGLYLIDLVALKHIDFGSLDYAGAGGVMWDTPSLESLAIKDLKGPKSYSDDDRNYRVELIHVGQISSVDFLFRNPIIKPKEGYNSPWVWLSDEAMPNVKEVTIGWNNLSSLSVHSKTMVVRLGLPDTKSMEIGHISVTDELFNIERGESLERLTVNEFEMRYNNNITELELPFDQLTTFKLLDCRNLTTITLPPEAKGWRNMTVDISGTALHLTTQPDEDSDSTWYWPESNMYRVEIDGLMARDFADDLPQITYHLRLYGYADGEFRCGEFEEKYKEKHKIPPNYSCWQTGSAFSTSALAIPLQLVLATAVAFALSL